MKSYKKKISELNECSFRNGDREILPTLINIWWSVPEDRLTDEQRRKIDSYYYRYRRQVLDMNDKEAKRICKLGYWDFHREISKDHPPSPSLEKGGGGMPVKEMEPVKVHYTKGQRQQMKIANQIRIEY